MSKRFPDKKFVEQTVHKAGLILAREQGRFLKQELDKRITPHSPKADFARALREMVFDKLDFVVDKLLYEATKASLAGLRPMAPAFNVRWEIARELLGCLSVLYVAPDMVERMEVALQQETGVFDIPVVKKMSATHVSRRFHQTPSSYAKGFAGEVALGIEAGLLPGSLSPEKAVVTLIVESIWPGVYGNAPTRKPTVDDPGRLTDEDLKQLNADLKQAEVERDPRHLVFEHAAGTPLEDPEFVALLQQKLPNLVVIRMVTPAGDCPIMASSEHALVKAIQRFLDIPNELSRKS